MPDGRSSFLFMTEGPDAPHYSFGVEVFELAWKLRDVVLMAILSVICGVVYTGWDLATKVPLQVWHPVLQAVLNGVWWLAAGLIPYIIRRPGAAFIAEFVSAIVEMLINIGGYSIYGVESGLLQGFGAEIAFAIFAWRRYNYGVMSLAGALAGLGYCVQYYFQYGGNSLPVNELLAYIAVTMASGAVLGGWLPKWIGDALKRTGVLRNFAIARPVNKA